METQEQNNDHIYWEDMRNRKQTLQELHEAMIKAKEHDDEEPFDEVESDLDAYNL